MTDELLQPNSEVEVTGTDQVKTEKTFTQKELDAAIKARLEREKASIKKASESWETEKETLTSEISSKDTLLDNYRKFISDSVSKQMEALPEHIKELLGKLDPLEQVEWLNKNAGQFLAKKGVPSIPDGEIHVDSKEQLKAKKISSGIY